MRRRSHFETLTPSASARSRTRSRTSRGTTVARVGEWDPSPESDTPPLERPLQRSANGSLSCANSVFGWPATGTRRRFPSVLLAAATIEAAEEILQRLNTRRHRANLRVIKRKAAPVRQLAPKPRSGVLETRRLPSGLCSWPAVGEGAPVGALSSALVRELPWSKNQLKKLGRSLAEGASLPDGVPSYSEVMLWYSELTSEVQRVVTGLPWESLLEGREHRVSARTKTLDTLVQKLRREQSMTLPTMRDVVGVRFEGDMNLDMQDAASQAIAAEFERLGYTTQVIDLRELHHQGYRAIHVVPRLAVDVEIQVRTKLQGEWANLYEGLGDLAGREIRYRPGGLASDVEALAEGLRALSVDGISRLEQLQNELDRGVVELARLEELVRAMTEAGGVDADALAKLRAKARDAHAEADGARAEIRGRTKVIRDIMSATLEWIRSRPRSTTTEG